MTTIGRGIRNAIRNAVRTISVVVILGLSIGLSLVMLTVRHGVSDKVAMTLSSIGNTVTICPPGYAVGACSGRTSRRPNSRPGPAGRSCGEPSKRAAPYSLARSPARRAVKGETAGVVVCRRLPWGVADRGEVGQASRRCRLASESSVAPWAYTVAGRNSGCRLVVCPGVRPNQWR